MLISVDLPAPFSPMMPVIDPRATLSDTARLACTAPNDLSIPLRSIAGGGALISPSPRPVGWAKRRVATRAHRWARRARARLCPPYDYDGHRRQYVQLLLDM